MKNIMTVSFRATARNLILVAPSEIIISKLSIDGGIKPFDRNEIYIRASLWLF